MGSSVKGVLGTKLGMTQVWDENNAVVPVTRRHARQVLWCRLERFAHPASSNLDVTLVEVVADISAPEAGSGNER